MDMAVIDGRDGTQLVENAGTDGPAYIAPDGTQEWYLNGQLHRTDGPAWIGTDGSQHWYLRGQNITEEVEDWKLARDITWPWDQSTQVEFALTWC